MNGVLWTWWRSAVRLRCCGVVAALYLYFAIALAFGQVPPPGGTPSDPPPAPNPAPASPAATADQIPGPAELLLHEVESIADKLTASGDKATAETLRQEVAKIRGSITGPFELPPADPYAVFAVYLNEAGPPPPGFGAGQDRFTTRYAEVQVGEFTQPTVLVLASSVKKMHWHVKKHDKTKLLAVIADCVEEAGVSGLDESTVILRSRSRDSEGNYGSWYDPDAEENDDYRSMRSRWSALAGGTVLTVSGQSTVAGKSVIVAADQPEFRGQVLARQARALHRRARGGREGGAQDSAGTRQPQV